MKEREGRREKLRQEERGKSRQGQHCEGKSDFDRERRNPLVLSAHCVLASSVWMKLQNTKVDDFVLDLEVRAFAIALPLPLPLSSLFSAALFVILVSEERLFCPWFDEVALLQRVDPAVAKARPA